VSFKSLNVVIVDMLIMIFEVDAYLRMQIKLIVLILL
jgi:hypothetical protein